MKIPKKKLKEWRELIDIGDRTRLSEELDINTRRIAKALDKGIASADDTIKINEWFAKKKQNIETHLNK